MVIKDERSCAIEMNFYVEVELALYVLTMDIAVHPSHLTISTKFENPLIFNSKSV